MSGLVSSCPRKGAASRVAARGRIRRGIGAALVVWVVALLASCSARDAELSPRETAPPEPAPLRSPGKRTQTSAPFDLDGVMRQVHFAFRKDGERWTGGHSTYGVRASTSAFSVRPASAEGEGAEATFETVSLTRGAARDLRGVEGRVEQDGHLAIARGDVTEHLRNDDEGVEQSFSFETQPKGNGDLEIRVRVTGQAYAGETAAGHHFVDSATGLGLRYGLATWIDGRGERTAVPVRYTKAEGELVLTVPEAVVEGSAYPAVLDPTIGPEFGIDAPIYFPVSAAQTYPQVAFDGTNYLVAWLDARQISKAGLQTVVGVRVTPAGVILDPGGFEIGTANSLNVSQNKGPAVAFAGTHYLVVWGIYLGYPDSTVVQGARVTPDGVVLDTTPKKYGTHTAQVSAVDVAASDTGSLVVWAVDGKVHAARVDATGAAVGSSFPVLASATKIEPNPVVGSNGTDFLVAWEDTRNNNIADIYGARVTADGAVLDPTGFAISLGAQTQLLPSIASNGTDYFVAWEDGRWGNKDIYGARVSSSGALLDPIGVQVSKNAGTQTSPSVAFDGSQYVVVWSDNRTGDYDIWQGRISVAGAALDGAGTPVAVATNQQSRPSVACAGGACFAAWEDLRAGGSNPAAYGARFTGSAVDDSLGLMLLSAANPQDAASVAYDGTNYLVVWQDLRNNTNLDIYAARVSPAGGVLDPSGIQVSAATGDQSSPKVVWGGSQYMIVWEDKRSGTYYDLYAARMSAAGVVADPSGIPLVAVANRHEQAPAIAFDGTNYLVTWQDNRAGSSSFAMYGALLTQAGTLLQPTGFLIGSSVVTGSNLAVAFGGGQYFVAWYASGVYLRGGRVTTAGAPLDGASGIAIRFISYGTGTVAAAYDGLNFSVAYTNQRVFLARVTGAGVLIDALEVELTPYTGANPAIAFDGTDCLVVWRDSRHGSNGAIYGSWVTEAGDVLTPGGQPFAGNGAMNHGRPALASDGAGHLLLAYTKGDTAPPYGSNRIRARLLTTSQPLGAACSASTDCGSGFCADGVCCNTSCGNSAPDCQACAVALGASADGTCTPLTGAVCDDGDACTQSDTCDAGACVGADPVVCTAEDECHDPGTCDPATGTCDDPAKPDGDPCSGGTCMSGVCESSGAGMGGSGGSGGSGAGGGEDLVPGGGADQAKGSAINAGCQASGGPASGAPIAALVLAAGLLVRRRVSSRREVSASRA